jgi:hypothetical protein
VVFKRTRFLPKASIAEKFVGRLIDTKVNNILAFFLNLAVKVKLG